MPSTHRCDLPTQEIFQWCIWIQNGTLRAANAFFDLRSFVDNFSKLWIGDLSPGLTLLVM
jgi:hypothetical protein